MQAARAIIVGAGLGGLAAGIALKKVGMQVAIYEKAPALAEVGAGIFLYPNALDALDRLGVLQQVETAGGIMRRGRYILGNGKIMDIDARSPELDRPSVAVHRAKLQHILADAFGRDQIFLDSPCKEVHSDPAAANDSNGAGITLADGRVVKGDFVVGADGLHSVVRAKTLNDGPPTYAGCYTWRGVCNMVPEWLGPDRAFVKFGPGTQFGGASLGPGLTYWFAAVAHPRGKQGRESKDNLLSIFGNWMEPIPTLIKATPADHILCHDIYDRPPVTRWSTGRITLLGDAAHPMTPFMGQGGCQALEDAIALAAAAKQAGDVASAFRAYEQARVKRTTYFVERSRESMSMSLIKNPIACGLRDFMLSVTPKPILVEKLHTLPTYELPQI